MSTTAGSDLPPMPYGVRLPRSRRWPVVLRAGALVMRPLHRRDEVQWLALRDKDWGWLGPWESTRPPGSAEVVPSFAHMVARDRRRARAGLALPWALCWDGGWQDAPHPRPSRLPVVGGLTVSPIVWGSVMSASVGYWVGADHAGRGMAPTALALASDYLFRVMGLHRVEVCVRPENERSLRVVAKLAMTEEGLRREYLHIDGQWRDHRVFRLLADDLPAGVLAHYLDDHVLPGSGLSR